jgi:phosphopantetheinyl transferase (holo-ACP synthase)
MIILSPFDTFALTAINSWDQEQEHGLIQFKHRHDSHFSSEFLIRDFFLSRQALLSCLRHLGAAPRFDDLMKKEFKKRYQINEHHFSLTHSRTEHGEVAAAILCTQKNVYVGIDIEPYTRVLQEGAAKFYKNPDDIELKPIELWSLKEAAFKCSSSYFGDAPLKKTLVLKDFTINNKYFTCSNTPDEKLLFGEYALMKKKINNVEYVLTVTWIVPPKNF